ncbi:DUF3885 domain-containing protein [Sporosarcina sp. A2]|uniref:DUF3885 domain-containing protein n=1 Tax=Sporosarcina sp. A2 TaxID=3393449 RepID=UPI003D790B51
MQPPLFSSWEHALRFEISKPGSNLEKPEDLQQAMYRAVALIDEILSDEDQLLVVGDVYTSKKHNFLENRPVSTYQMFVKNEEVLSSLRYELIPESSLEDGEEMVTHRFLHQVHKNQIHYEFLVETKCCEHVRVPITGLKNNPRSGYEFYLINQSRNIIYHLYGERGCDIIAADREELRTLYEMYSDWIEEENRERMDAMFLDPGNLAFT